jgi:cold shock CspA family protein
MNGFDTKLVRIGIFYDGNYFYHVSNYYQYVHLRRARISIPGLHDFIRNRVAKEEGCDIRFCHVVDAHYFRGRLSADDADANQRLLTERKFDDILMRAGVVTHYLPLGPRGEKGIDVWLALEALELTQMKHFDVVVLVASDGDFLPLVRKLNVMGTRVMVMAWDFQFTDRRGENRRTITSIDLLDAVTYPVQMHTIIDDKTLRHDPSIANLFVRKPLISNGYGPEARTPLTGRPEVDTRMYVEPRFEAETRTPLEPRPDPGIRMPVEPRFESDTRSVAEAPSDQEAMPDEAPEEAPSDTGTDGAGEQDTSPTGDKRRGRIHNLQNGYGFITTDTPMRNLFFFWEDVVNVDFNDLSTGDEVEYVLGQNARGECAREIRRL